VTGREVTGAEAGGEVTGVSGGLVIAVCGAAVASVVGGAALLWLVERQPVAARVAQASIVSTAAVGFFSLLPLLGPLSPTDTPRRDCT
jgi:hypothetical protein